MRWCVRLNDRISEWGVRLTLQHTAAHCNTLQHHTATYCNTLQHTAARVIERGVRLTLSSARYRVQYTPLDALSSYIIFREDPIISGSFAKNDLQLEASYETHIPMWDMTHSYVRHDSFLRETWLIPTWDMTHAYVRHDSFTTHSYVPQLTHNSSTPLIHTQLIYT